MSSRRPSTSWLEAIGLASSLGFQFAIAAGSGIALGYFLDRLFGLRPVVFTALVGLFGAAAGFVLILRTLTGFERRSRRRDQRTPEKRHLEDGTRGVGAQAERRASKD